MLSFMLSLFISTSSAKEFVQKDYCLLVGGINHQAISDVIKCLKNKNKIFVDSPGGIIDAGNILIDYVNKHKTTVMCVRCYSMAAFIWLNAEKKEFGEDGDMMVHYGYTFFHPDQPATIPLMRQMADELEQETEVLFNKCSPYQKEYFIQNMKRGDFFFDQSVIDALQIKYTLIKKPKQKEK